MAIKTREEILNSLKAKFGDDTTDESLGIIEDVTDTLADFETRLSDTTDWKTKYENNDASWRKKYRDRFFNGGSDDDTGGKDDEDDKPLTYENLFKIEER